MHENTLTNLKLANC